MLSNVPDDTLIFDITRTLRTVPFGPFVNSSKHLAQTVLFAYDILCESSLEAIAALGWSAFEAECKRKCEQAVGKWAP